MLHITFLYCFGYSSRYRTWWQNILAVLEASLVCCGHFKGRSSFGGFIKLKSSHEFYICMVQWEKLSECTNYPRKPRNTTKALIAMHSIPYKAAQSKHEVVQLSQLSLLLVLRSFSFSGKHVQLVLSQYSKWNQCTSYQSELVVCSRDV